MRKFLPFLLLSLLCCSFSAATAPVGGAQAEVTVAEITNNWLAREREIKSFGVTWKFKQTHVKGSLIPKGAGKRANPNNLDIPPADYTFEGSCCLIGLKDKVRYDYQSELWHTDESQFKPWQMTQLFDGKTNTNLTWDGEKNTASIRPEAYVLSLATPETRAIALALRPSALPGSILEPERLVLASVRPVVDGVQCYVLEDQGRNRSYWVDPAKRLSIVRYVEQTKNGATIQTLDIDWFDHNGIWLPKAWHLSKFNNDGSVLTDIMAGETSYQINESVEWSAFEPKYPPRTVIFDAKNRTANRVTISAITSDSSKRTLNPVEYGKVTYDELVTPQASTNRVFYWVSGVVLVLVVFLALFRKRVFFSKGEKK